MTTYKAHYAPVAAVPASDSWPLEDWYFRVHGETTIEIQKPVFDAVAASDEKLFRQTLVTKHGGADYRLPEAFVAGIHDARMFTIDSAVGSRNGLFEGALEDIGLFDRVLPRTQKIV